ncbi:hypothetical protein ACI7BZ_12535 [Xanthobacter sp. AM11]|uniref:hypothetical protein n=1 Tax=Xanthobacter sp. AM11 TaxID=3380643 RepID=UPI0039BF29F5
MGWDVSAETLRQLARRMAQSGKFCSWRLIQIELRFMQGIREAESCFGDTAIRFELDDLCRQAQRRPAAAPARTQTQQAAAAFAYRRPAAAHLRLRTAN